MKIFKLLTLVIIGSRSAWAVQPEDVLRTAWKDNRVQLHDSSIDRVENASSYNFLNRASLRIDRSDLNEDSTKYGLRLHLKGWSELRTTSAFQAALEKNEKLARGYTLSEILVSRYDLLARIALLKEKKAMADEMQIVSLKANKIHSLGAQTNRADLNSYLKNKNDLVKVDLKIADILRDYKNLQNELKKLSLGDADSFNIHDLISMEVLKERLETDLIGLSDLSLTTQLAEVELDKSLKGISYEKARDDKWLDYLEISVKKNNEKDENIYGVEVGINLPFLSAPDLSQIDKDARSLQNKVKLITAGEISDRAYHSGLSELKTLLEVHKTLAKNQMPMDFNQMKKASRKISPHDPVLALQLQQAWFENKEQILDLEYRIRSLYILYLHEASKLVDHPERNYFSQNLKGIL